MPERPVQSVTPSAHTLDCPECGKAYLRKDYLGHHIRRGHPKEKDALFSKIAHYPKFAQKQATSTHKNQFTATMNARLTATPRAQLTDHDTPDTPSQRPDSEATVNDTPSRPAKVTERSAVPSRIKETPFSAMTGTPFSARTETPSAIAETPGAEIPNGLTTQQRQTLVRAMLYLRREPTVDCGLIYEKIRDGTYTSLEGVIHEFYLVVDNALGFSGEDGEKAEKVRGMFQAFLNEIPEAAAVQKRMRKAAAEKAAGIRPVAAPVAEEPQPELTNKEKVQAWIAEWNRTHPYHEE